jgi:hypothetical protein
MRAIGAIAGDATPSLAGLILRHKIVNFPLDWPTLNGVVFCTCPDTGP